VQVHLGHELAHFLGVSLEQRQQPTLEARVQASQPWALQRSARRVAGVVDLA